MEWTRIETKWHDMARRLQQASPGVRQPAGTDPDDVTPEHSPDVLLPVLREAEDMAARAMI